MGRHPDSRGSLTRKPPPPSHALTTDVKRKHPAAGFIVSSIIDFPYWSPQPPKALCFDEVDGKRRRQRRRRRRTTTTTLACLTKTATPSRNLPGVFWRPCCRLGSRIVADGRPAPTRALFPSFWLGFSRPAHDSCIVWLYLRFGQSMCCVFGLDGTVLFTADPVPRARHACKSSNVR